MGLNVPGTVANRTLTTISEIRMRRQLGRAWDYAIP